MVELLPRGVHVPCLELPEGLAHGVLYPAPDDVKAYEPGDGTVTALAGTPMETIARAVAELRARRGAEPTRTRALATAAQRFGAGPRATEFLQQLAEGS